MEANLVEVMALCAASVLIGTLLTLAGTGTLIAFYEWSQHGSRKR